MTLVNDILGTVTAQPAARPNPIAPTSCNIPSRGNETHVLQGPLPGQTLLVPQGMGTGQGQDGDGKQWGRGTTAPTFAFALVHHFEVGVVSALGCQQVTLVPVGVAIGAADLQLSGQAGAVGGTGTLGTPVLHLADLVWATHHPLTALWGQRDSNT